MADLGSKLESLALEVVDPKLDIVVLELEIATLSLKLLKLPHIIVIRILIPRMWQKFICAIIRNQMISF